MNDPATLKRYIKYFKKYLEKRVQSGIKIKTIAHPVRGEGAVIEFILDNNLNPTVEILKPQETLNNAVNNVEQNLISGNIQGVKFSGTNISMQGNKIVLIKGENEDAKWIEKAAKEDLNRIFHHRYRS